MLHSCAEYLTHTLYRHCPLSEEKRPVFVYGFELSLSTLSSILSIILLSIIFKNVYFSLLFLYIFFFLRLFSGGYHAPTYSRCFILTNAICIPSERSYSVVQASAYSFCYFILYLHFPSLSYSKH